MAKVNRYPPAPGVGGVTKLQTDDPSRYVVPLSKFQRPRFYVVGGSEFEFPLGTEGMRLQGAATLAEHKYVSDNAPVIQVTHRDATIIVLEGMFPGKTGAENVRALRQMCMQADPPDGKRLELPAILPQAQKVIADNWEFSRVENDAWSFTYMVTFRIIAVTSTQHQTATSPKAPTGPKGNPKGITAQSYTVVQGTRTLRTSAYQIWGNANKWRDLYDMNKAVLNRLYPNSQISSMSTKVLPVGLKLVYART